LPSGPKATSPEAWLPNWKQPLASSSFSVPVISQPSALLTAVSLVTRSITTQPAVGGSVVAGFGQSSYCWPGVPHLGTTGGLSRGSRL
jgi:hypothetical protein